MGVSAWYRSTLCLVFHDMSWVHGRSTLCFVFDGGLSNLDYIKRSFTGTFHSFRIKLFVGDCPLLLNKVGYWRLSSAFEIKLLLEIVHCF